MRSPWRLLLVLLIALSVGGPQPVLAQLAPGGSAVVQADGDGLVLREGPGYDATALDLIADGTIVGIMDGPIYAEDGSVWYYVSLGDGLYGYVVSDWLVERVFPDPGPGQTGNGHEGEFGAEAGTSGCSGVADWLATVSLEIPAGRAEFRRVVDLVNQGELLSASAMLGLTFIIAAEMQFLTEDVYTPPSAYDASSTMLSLWDAWSLAIYRGSETGYLTYDVFLDAVMAANSLDAQTSWALGDVAWRCGVEGY